VYKQVTAVIATIGLAAALARFGYDWRGALASVVGWWDQVARPPMKWLFMALITTPLSWFGWHVDIPLWIRDYFAIGVIYSLSFLRASRTLGRNLLLPRSIYPQTRAAVVFMYVPAWPLVMLNSLVLIAITAFDIVRGNGREAPMSRKLPTASTGPGLVRLDRTDSSRSLKRSELSRRTAAWWWATFRAPVVALTPVIFLGILVALNIIVFG